MVARSLSLTIFSLALVLPSAREVVSFAPCSAFGLHGALLPCFPTGSAMLEAAACRPRVGSSNARGGLSSIVMERVRSGKEGGKRGGKSSSTSSKRWLNEHVNDKWVKDAQKAGYRSRAAFKLLQLQEADTLLKPGQVVLDLGSAPGSWSQVARKLLGPTGKIIATDILEMKSLPGVTFIQGDFLEDFARGEIALALNGSRADVILSDMAPNLSGNSIIDQGRAFNLVELAMFMCQSWLKTGGSFACKVFQGEGYNECLATMKEQFTSVKIRKPKASRERSSELFLVGTGFIRGDSKAKDAGEVQNEAVGDWAIGDAPPSAESREAGANTRKKKKMDDLMDGMLG